MKLNAVCRNYEIEFMGDRGASEIRKLSDLKLMPKKRYEIMSETICHRWRNGTRDDEKDLLPFRPILILKI